MDPVIKDSARVAAVHRLDVHGSEREATFDRITELAASLFEVPLATIHLLDDVRQWVKAASGGRRAPDTAIGETFCELTVSEGDVLVVPDLSRDPRFRENRFVTGEEGLRFYAGAPLRSREGHIVGTLCLMDVRPRSGLDAYQTGLFRQLADVVTEALELRVARSQALETLKSALNEDAITGQLSRHGVLRYLQRRLNGEGSTWPVAGVKLRLDRLDLVQRALGSEARNMLLRQAAERLECLREDGDLLGLTGEATFFMARPFPLDARDGNAEEMTAWAEAFAAEALNRLAEPYEVEGEIFHLSSNAGVACAPQDAQDAYSLLDAADEAVSQARTEATGTVRRYSPETAMASRRRLSLEGRLRRGIESANFRVFYQPVVDLNDECRVVGAEALLRWPLHDDPPVTPDTFIALAEERGLITELGRFAFGAACRQAAEWHASGRDLWISVNLSPVDLRAPDLSRGLIAAVAAAGLDPGAVTLEITESALVDDYEEVARTLQGLSEAGFSLALDDFGTGHSSLTRLIRLPFSVLKVDRGFVADSPGGPGAAVVSSLSGLASSLGMYTLAEGVETAEQEAFLRTEGYRLAQGYRYARPMAAADFAANLVNGAETQR